MDSASSEGTPFKLTVVIPVYNEENTLREVLGALAAQPIPGDTEIIVVDDGSTDRTAEILAGLDHVVLRHEVNRGKGAAVLTGIERATGTHLLIFDGDSEYDPAEIASLVDPILAGRAEVVYGVRVRGLGTVFPSLLYALGNRVMTGFANLLFGAAINDAFTCLKLFPLPLVRRMRLGEPRFALDAELTSEMLRLGFRPYELPVSYVGRSREEGKKIGFADARRSVIVMAKVRMRGRIAPGARDRSLAPRVLPPKRSRRAKPVAPGT
jgi:glycosyltransferase involved in cell wall biosynthesis